jgi:hypothetical protein
VFPAKIEAEDFDRGGEGVAYHDADVGNNGSQYRTTEDVDIETCTDVDGGYNVGWLNPGEWLEYTVTVPTAGEYTIDTRVASLSSGGSFHVEFNGVDKTGEVTVPVTGGWQTWTTAPTTVTLSAGTQTMRFVITTSGFNLNYLDVGVVTTAIEPGLRPTGNTLHPCYPNPLKSKTTISYTLSKQEVVYLTIYDVTGRRVQTLVGGEQLGAGPHEAVWNGRDATGRTVPGGIYFCELNAGGYSETIRMVVLP